MEHYKSKGARYLKNVLRYQEPVWTPEDGWVDAKEDHTNEETGKSASIRCDVPPIE